MNIAILTTTYFPESNGASIRTDGLAFGLHEWGHHVFIFAPGKQYSHEKLSYADIYRIPVKKNFFANFCERFTKFNRGRYRAFKNSLFPLLAKERIDIVHTRQPLDLFMIGKEAKQQQMIWTTEAHKFLSKTDYENNLISFRRYTQSLAKERELLNQSDLVVTMTPSGKKTLQEAGITTEIIPIHNATKINPAAEGNFSFDNHYSYLLYAGTIREVEAVDEIIRICYQLNKTLLVKLLILGQGKSHHLRALAKQLGIEQHIYFLGEIPFDRIGYFYKHATLFIQPRPDITYHRDIIGLKCYDALACGLPLVVSDVGELGDLVKRRKIGITFPAGNYDQCAQSIKKILSHTRAYSLLRKNATRIGKTLTWKNACIALHQRLKQLAQRAPSK